MLVYHQPKQSSIRAQIDVNKYLSPSVYVTRHGNKIFGVSDVIRVAELTRVHYPDRVPSCTKGTPLPGKILSRIGHRRLPAPL